MKYFNIETITGSSSKGGSEAIRNIIKSLKSGISIGMTPDGPRGPRMKVNSAIIKIASLTGHKIVPLSYSVKKKFFLNSWDKFLVALPFGKGCFIWGKPIKIKKNIIFDEHLVPTLYVNYDREYYEEQLQGIFPKESIRKMSDDNLLEFVKNYTTSEGGSQ